ncbi:hypothetical protein EV363DRAFT_1163307 [Boletus edulis]|nr:hypothetical protein EV363DRAFT_1163307 [Boletus edulis]
MSYLLQDHPLLTWLDDRELFLQELIRLEGRGDQGLDGECGACKSATACYRCSDCFGGVMYCKWCIIQQHAASPLHRVKEWNGQYFKRTSLKAIGLRIQLGHLPSEKCLNPQRAFDDDFVVIDSHGIHEVAVDFCHCEHGKDHTRQLLRMCWFPSTSVNPRSAVSFRLLEEFQLLSFESKASAYEFYRALARRQDNTGLANKDRYESFLRVIREWRNLKMLKRSGRGHDPIGIPGTADGDCAVLCPACPQPGKNLPDDWEFAPQKKSWLYALFVALDANFRLKRKAVSSDEVDPSLSNGWAYFVDEYAYKEHLKTQVNVTQPKSSCSSHDAVNLADVKNSSGLAATGVGTVECARHNLKRPNGVGNLQKGERYVNMDYLFFSSLRHSPLRSLNVSYDIACQWSKNLWDRMTTLPRPMQIQHDDKCVKFFVPKFHLPAHIMRCQTQYSFNFIPHVGRTDGEAPERGWANINPVASSTKEMGPGSRRDTINDHFGDYNWKKVCGMGTFLGRKLREALKEHAEHKSTLEELEAAVVQDDAMVLSAWQTEIVRWESDPTEPNPFESKTDAPTQHSVRLQLAKQDTKSFEEGDQYLHEVTPSMFISSGLDLEELQRRLRVDRAKLSPHATDLQEGGLLTRSSSLKRKIDSWARVQLLYMPTLASKRGPGSSSTLLPENFKLWLPSELMPSTPCSPLLRHYEWQLRHAQAHDALDSLRQALRCRSYLYKFKDANLRGQGANTRARNLLKKVDTRIEAASVQYQTAYNALTALGPLLQRSSWQLDLQPLRTLRAEDIRAMTDLLDGETMGRKSISWIWKVRGAMATTTTDDAAENAIAQEAVRMEWCKARARAMRWGEEVVLLSEEMRRVLEFLRWDASRWEGWAKAVPLGESAQTEGHVAYAIRQATVKHTLLGQFEEKWAELLANPKVHGVVLEYTGIQWGQVAEISSNSMEIGDPLCSV